MSDSRVTGWNHGQSNLETFDGDAECGDMRTYLNVDLAQSAVKGPHGFIEHKS